MLTIHNYSDASALQSLIQLGHQCADRCDDYSLFPSRMYALLYILLHVPRSIVSSTLTINFYGYLTLMFLFLLE